MQNIFIYVLFVPSVWLLLTNRLFLRVDIFWLLHFSSGETSYIHIFGADLFLLGCLHRLLMSLNIALKAC